MGLKKSHLVEFLDGSAKATGRRNDDISSSYSGEESLSRFEVDGVSCISGNSAGLVKLGELLIQIGLSEYENGFHLHIREDFDADKSEILIVGLNNPNSTPSPTNR
jgi:hypothetical protein